jgi:NAD(P)-dependent dehydrogenase (short-subunit alcohol dehydrogenase family)
MYESNQLLKGKIAVVSGAAQGIGRGIAELFSHEGATVVFCDINKEGAENAALETGSSTGQSVDFAQIDVTDKQAVDAFIKKIVETHKKIDILANVAGIVRLAPLVDLSEEDWDAVMSVNVKGPLFMMQAVGKVMMEQKHGKIINIASDSGKRPFPNEAAYCSSKSALIGLTRVGALELGRYNINCNAICPGATDTPLLREYYMKTDEDRKEYAAATALNRIAEPHDIAKVAVFFASHYSDHITGEVVLATAGDGFGE